jgi:tetratricopeptide (TPR) repeat protein
MVSSARETIFMTTNTLKALVLWGGALALPAFAQAPAHLNQAEQLVRSGQAAQAYAMLAPEQFNQAGQPEFDYLFGLAALETGQASTATLAFERVLAVAPNHGAARLDMGRAYVELGDLPRARQEFALALALNPPPAARATIARYQAEMDAREQPPATRLTAYVEAGLGSDGNVTQGPSSSTLFLPVFGANFTLDAANQKIQDKFSQINAGADLKHRLSDSVSLYGGVDTKWRHYGQQSSFNSGSTDLRGGVQWQVGRNTWRAGAGYNDYRLGNQAYRAISSVGGEFQHALTPRQQLMAFGQYAQVRYAQDSQASNDVNQWVLGAGWVSQLATARPSVLSLSAYIGNETEADRARPRSDGDKDFVGLRAGGQISLRPDLDVYATAGVQVGHYQRANSLFAQQRADELYELALGSVWRFAPSWSVKPQISWTHNHSNLSLNDYQRHELSLLLRRDFQ